MSLVCGMRGLSVLHVFRHLAEKYAKTGGVCAQIRAESADEHIANPRRPYGAKAP